MRRWVLWCGFGFVHLLVGWLCLVAEGLPLGDVVLVYRPWVEQATAGGPIPAVDEPWVYPILAIVPMLIPLLLGSAGYGVGWLLMVSVLNAGAFAVLLGNGHSRPRLIAAGWWLAFLLLLGPIALARIDSVTVPIAIVGLLWVAGRPRVAAVLLTIAAWMKIWPAALVGAIVLTHRHRGRVVAAAAATSAVVLGVGLLLGGANAVSFVTEQTGRGLQIESLIGNAYLWLAVLRVPQSFVYYDRDILTFQVTGPGVDTAIAVMTPLLAIAVAGVVLLGVLAVRTGRPLVTVLAPLALLFVLTLIVFNKVGSPQFAMWLAAPVILGLVLQRRRFIAPAVITLVIAALTQLVYPYLYLWLLNVDPVLVTVLTVRNLAYLVLAGWAVHALFAPAHPEDDAVSSSDPVRVHARTLKE
ncbi:glycosyltransferase 87 family protein [Plantibacter sp. ME-Dv--P-095]|uniref:glycosyltransferase 87 family protein n=1 Tax=Plantibacter sp. ME-Dv--P-095 TaxID=3040299 RepID=UPI00254EFED5|nr:glycosyltransferase 87 family protein [Plantibacter sp. ME-Dv--P-095]